MDLNEAIICSAAILARSHPHVLRPTTKEIKDYPLVRENIKVASVKDARILPTDGGSGFKIGYARITQFNVPTADELATKLDELEKQGMQAFVLDLRYNPGGS
jgi:carboxyl-terminal processing protease